MATKAKTNTTEPLWAALMDYTGVYGPIEVIPKVTPKGKKLTIVAGDTGMSLKPGDRGLKWAGDGNDMGCAYIAADKKEVMAWLKGVQAVHRMFRSSMRKGK